MYRFILLFCVTFCLNTSVNAMSAYVEGTIILKDGKELSGLVLFAGPQSMLSKTIKYKTSKKGDVEKFDSDDIRYVVVTSAETPLVFEYSIYNEFTILQDDKKTRYKTWNRLISNCEGMNVYICNQFSFNKRGEMFIIYDQSLSQNSFLVQRKGEEIPTEVGTTRDGNKVTRGARVQQNKRLSEYFYDNPALVSKIQKNQWDVRNLGDIIEHVCGQG